MVRDTAVAEIRKGLGFRPAEATLDAIIVSELQVAQRDLEQGKSLPWFLLQENQPLTLLIGDSTANLPTGFIREEENQPLAYGEAGDVYATHRVERRTNWDAVAAYADSEPAGPKVYVIRKSVIFFVPVADKTYTLFWSYYKADTVLTTNIENNWLLYAPDLMIGEAGRRIAMKQRDNEAVAAFDNMRKDARVALFAEQVARDESGGPISLGSAL